MFRGLSSISVDVKGRMSVPARHRNKIDELASGEMIVTIDTEDPCLLLYTLPDWERIEAKIAALPSFNPASRRIQRLLLGHATDVHCDGNGRILLPQVLRDFAGIDNRVMLVGQGKKFEIWNESTWNSKCLEWLAMERAGLDSLPEQLGQLSL